MSGFKDCRRQTAGRRSGSNEWLDLGREQTQVLVFDVLVSMSATVNTNLGLY